MANGGIKIFVNPHASRGVFLVSDDIISLFKTRT